MPNLRVLLPALVLCGCVGAPEPTPRADFVVFFAGQSESLDPAAAHLLDSAASVARRAGGAVTVAGFADRPGTPQANQILSRLRAQAVADGLLARGVERPRIRLRPRDALGADPGLESRRVDIRVGE